MLAAMPTMAQEDSVSTKNTQPEAANISQARSPLKKVTMVTYPDLADDPIQFNIQYTSKNAKNEKVALSARVYVPEPFDKIDSKCEVTHVILNCHPTVTSNFESPTGTGAMDKDIKRMCGVHNVLDGLNLTGYYMVICPDYCGYGLSSYLQHPYLIHDITAANCIDAILPAIEEAKNRNTKIGSWDLTIVGYSQGGATALACAKYLESDGCPQNLKDKINLRETFCGDGPYSTPATVSKYMEWGVPTEYGGPDKDLEYPCVLPLILGAAKEAYGDGCMNTVDVETFFSEEFRNTGIIDMLKTKVLNTDDLNNEIKELMPRRRPVDVFSPNIINPDGTFKTETNEYKCLMRAMEIGDLTKGWQPQHPITFYHLPNDVVVPYANFEEAKKGFGTDKKHIRFLEAKDAHKGGKLFDVLSWAEDISNPDFQNTNHTDGGMLFYVDFLFGGILRQIEWWK